MGFSFLKKGSPSVPWTSVLKPSKSNCEGNDAVVSAYLGLLGIWGDLPPALESKKYKINSNYNSKKETMLTEFIVHG